jgi:hypothetical protein
MQILYRDILALGCGAQFLNVDLHIHSYGASKDVKDVSMTPQEIVDSAATQGLSVIAITDHNSDRNVAAALTHAQKYAEKLLVVPGVEVTTAHGHLLVYFAPEKAAELSRFLAKLDLVGEMGDQNTHTAKSMADVIGEADRLGGVCVAAHIDRPKTGFETLAPGYPNWKRDILTSPGLYGLECDEAASLAWYSDLEEPGSAGAERKKLLEARRSVAALQGRRDLAHLQGSDAHEMDRFENPDPDKPWTRIKMTQLSFAALRTALIDPTARIVARASVPRSIPRVRGMAVEGGFLHGELIRFSDNLNCFIGGRGTGKSTAMRSLAYCFGIDEGFGEFESCPDAVVVYCEDADGIVYRYERAKGGEIAVKVKEDQAVIEAPADSFRIEYFGQGELARVAEDPLKNPRLFQEFLDRHINLGDLVSLQASIVGQLRTNAGRLVPLEGSFGQLESKKKSLADIETKLRVAEDGKLREIVGVQKRIASEKTVRATMESVIAEYEGGVSLAEFEKDFGQITATAGEVSEDPGVKATLEGMRKIVDAANAALTAKAKEVSVALKAHADDLRSKCAELKAHHARMEAALATKIADLKAKGLAGNLAELDQLLKQKVAGARDVSAIEQKGKELEQCRSDRQRLLTTLKETREEMTKRRKDQLQSINANLARTITDYQVFVKYEDTGIVEEFCRFITEKMHGTYFQDDAARQLCERVSPGDLAGWVLDRDHEEIAKATGLGMPWPERIVDKLCYWNILFELEVLSKQPKPVITVLTRSAPPKRIAVGQLSDGQRHTILLTIAMLAESNVPLVIDQPEDDLDNAFIFSSIVTTLRTIKERRQVILITHNANIAVLGDSELLLPMRRDNDCGKAVERGAIDREATKRVVEEILEGGPEAFRRRQEIYGH